MIGDARFVTVHAAGHSAGAIFHSRFLPAADRLGVRSFGSLQLLAPALRVDEFESTLLPMIGTSIDRFAMYTLTAADRPYRSANTVDEALAIMGRMAEQRIIDADLFARFVQDEVWRHAPPPGVLG